MDLIISHKSCPDGFCAAFIAHKKYPNAEILPLNHGDPLPLEQVRGKDIIVLDFSWKRREDNEAVAAATKSIWILDHHKTSLAACQGLPYATFDMNRSGAGLTWDYLFGKDFTPIRRNSDVKTFEEAVKMYTWDQLISTTSGNSVVDIYKYKVESDEEARREREGEVPKPRPWYVNYIEDYDLWNHKLICTREVNAFLHSLNFDFAEWEELDKINFLDASERGKYIVRNSDRYVKLALKQAFEGRLTINQGFDPEGFSCDYSVKIVNALYTYASEIGAALVESGADIGMTWFERGDGMIQFSLRSKKGGPVDVSAVANRISPLGGGHQAASGLPLPIYQGRALIDSILNRKCGMTVKWE